MNDSGPLTPEQIDLLLSAELDGEFDAAASDLGVDAATARTRLDAEPNAAARRAQLEAARALLAEPIEIDELLAARLRSKAVKAGSDAADEQRHGQRASRTRVFGIVSGIAAALLVVVALGAMLRTTDSGSKSSDSAGGAPVEAQAPTSLRAETSAGDTFADQQLSLNTSYDSVDALATDARRQSAAFSYAPKAASSFTSGAAADAAASPSKKSAYTCAPAAQKLVESARDQPLANGTTQVAGRPFSVLLYGSPDGRTVLVFDQDCKLVNQQLIH